MAYSIWCELCFAYLKFIIWGGFCMEHIVILYKYYSLSLKHIFLGEGIRFLPHFGKAKILPRASGYADKYITSYIYVYVLQKTSVYTKTTAHRVLLNSSYIHTIITYNRARIIIVLMNIFTTRNHLIAPFAWK